MRKDASTNAHRFTPRKAVIIEQLKDYDGWKKRQDTGTSGEGRVGHILIQEDIREHIRSKWEKIVRELIVKASVYNLFMGLDHERVMNKENPRESGATVELFDTPRFV